MVCGCKSSLCHSRGCAPSDTNGTIDPYTILTPVHQNFKNLYIPKYTSVHLLNTCTPSKQKSIHQQNVHPYILVHKLFPGNNDPADPGSTLLEARTDKNSVWAEICLLQRQKPGLPSYSVPLLLRTTKCMGPCMEKSPYLSIIQTRAYRRRITSIGIEPYNSNY